MSEEITSGTWPKNASVMVSKGRVKVGTTLEMTAPEICSGFTPAAARRFENRTPYSSEVFLGSVANRQWPFRVRPPNSPQTMLELPISMANSMGQILPCLRLESPSSQVEDIPGVNLQQLRMRDSGRRGAANNSQAAVLGDRVGHPFDPFALR
ncbi:MAG: hypothetical protein KatS3mg082_0228 [Nitrospiraceae bacterium]|nr:MAG: hypothetical protein KatS3mg082_0228 [Nitrospiraceae bacterium]